MNKTDEETKKKFWKKFWVDIEDMTDEEI